MHGSPDIVRGYDSVKAFGEIMPGNFNALMKKDEAGGIYVHYRTEKSVLNDTGNDEEEKNDNEENSDSELDSKEEKQYYKSLIVRSADTEALAKAKITKKGYYVLDQNIANDARKNYSKEEEWAFSYIGFTVTSNPEEALTDRAKPYGEPLLATYIHAKFERDGNAYFNKLYAASGTTKRRALAKLLENGCTDYCDLNLNEGAHLTEKEYYDEDNKVKGGEYVYFGYRGYTLNEKYINSFTTKKDREAAREEELEEAVYDVVCTVGEKTRSGGILAGRTRRLRYLPWHPL